MARGLSSFGREPRYWKDRNGQMWAVCIECDAAIKAEHAFWLPILAAHHYYAVVNSAVGWMGNGYGDFRAAIIAALAAAMRNESEVEG